mmetsp:Transcript_13166/g.27870  ORF Transcript_13166/g.27870 Transcript_13166/m.27870 type:complete len:97 (+) Transcript_13166:289-579(+)
MARLTSKTLAVVPGRGRESNCDEERNLYRMVAICFDLFCFVLFWGGTSPTLALMHLAWFTPGKRNEDSKKVPIGQIDIKWEQLVEISCTRCSSTEQ